MTWLTQDEVTALVANLLENAGDEGLLKTELVQAIDELDEMRLNGLLVQLAIEGRAPISVENGQVMWKRP